MRARYVSGLYPLAEMGPPLRRQGAQVGLARAEVWVPLSDGGAGLEDWVRANFPRVEAVILDLFHAAEYLGGLARAAYPHDEERARGQAASWAHLLRGEGGDAMVGVLEAWDGPAVRGLAAVRAEVLVLPVRVLQLHHGVRGLAAVRAEVLGYFRNQAHRMDDPAYEANGWYIGSGAVEGACKTVVGQRLRGSGMRWGEAGAHAVCHVRALYRNEPGQWDAFWQRAVAA